MVREWVEASITAGGRETRYIRSGRGRVVLLLSTGGLATVPADPVLERLGAGFRVIAADIPPGLVEETPAAFTGWVDGVIDGLGLRRAAIVADPRVAPCLTRPNGFYPDRVALILVVDLEGSTREDDDARLRALLSAAGDD